MTVDEGRTLRIEAIGAEGPIVWGTLRRAMAVVLIVATLVAGSLAVFAGTAAAQVESDPVLQWLPQIEAAAGATGVPAEYIAAVIRVESGGDPNAVSVAGAIGLMQVMPAEFQSQGIPESAWFDPATNILAGSTEIGRFLAATGSIEQALASYFGMGCDAVGTCTDGYIATVLSFAAAYATAIANGTTADLSGVQVSTGSGTAGSHSAAGATWTPAGADGSPSGEGWDGQRPPHGGRPGGDAPGPDEAPPDGSGSGQTDGATTGESTPTDDPAPNG